MTETQQSPRALRALPLDAGVSASATALRN